MLSAENREKPTGGRDSATNPAVDLSALPMISWPLSWLRKGLLPFAKNAAPALGLRPFRLATKWKILGTPLSFEDSGDPFLSYSEQAKTSQDKPDQHIHFYIPMWSV